MTSKKASQPVGKAYAAFLFADLRGFTSFTRTHGDEAAYRLVQQFYELVRTQNAHQGGREWKTEGDQILLAFSTAYQAALAAVKVMEAIEAYNGSNPEHPIRVGIGLDAGEPVASEGDFIGTAVNRTARVTALAKAGQILATETMRQLAGNLPDIVHIDRGRHAFHGFDEAQQVYELVWPGKDTPRPTHALLGSLIPVAERLRPTPRIGLGVALAATFLVAVLFSGANPIRPSPQWSATSWPAAEVVPISEVVAATKSIPQLVADSRRFTVFIVCKHEEGVHVGSGVVYNSSGLVVTAAHVVQDVANVDIHLWDGTAVSAEVLGRSKEHDLAVLQMPVARYPAATFGDSSRARAGDDILVLGYPATFRFDTPATATRGMISQTFAGPQNQYLQIDADLNPGDSGGPLLNSAGQVIGINVDRVESLRGRTIQGIGIAIPSRTVQDVIAKLTRGD